MKKILFSLLLIAAIAVPASADPFTLTVGSSTTIGFGTFVTQGAPHAPGYNLYAEATFKLTSANTLEVTLKNLSPNGSDWARPALTAIAFSTTPTIAGVSVTSLTGGLDWHLPPATGFGNGSQGIMWEVRVGDSGRCNIGAAPGTSTSGAICNDQQGSFAMTFTPPITAGGTLRIDVAGVKFQTGDLNGGSYEIVVIPTGEVPEPASLALLGTGLISAGGFIRRKLAR